MELTEGSEPSQYLQEEKTTVIPQVAASERGRAQTEHVLKPAGVAWSVLREPLGSSAEGPEGYKAGG